MYRDENEVQVPARKRTNALPHSDGLTALLRISLGLSAIFETRDTTDGGGAAVGSERVELGGRVGPGQPLECPDYGGVATPTGVTGKREQVAIEVVYESPKFLC